MRLEKGIQRAEAVLDQQEKKVENSARKGKVVKDRSVSCGLTPCSQSQLKRIGRLGGRE